MSWNVNYATMLFLELDTESAGELEFLAGQYIVRGIPNFEHPAVVAWADEAGHDERQMFLSYHKFVSCAALSSSMYFRKCAFPDENP